MARKKGVYFPPLTIDTQERPRDAVDDCDVGKPARRKASFLLSFPYACPEPVLANVRVESSLCLFRACLGKYPASSTQVSKCPHKRRLFLTSTYIDIYFLTAHGRRACAGHCLSRRPTSRRPQGCWRMVRCKKLNTPLFEFCTLSMLVVPSLSW
jgi:hypothetical protein